MLVCVTIIEYQRCRDMQHAAMPWHHSSRCACRIVDITSCPCPCSLCRSALWCEGVSVLVHFWRDHEAGHSCAICQATVVFQTNPGSCKAAACLAKDCAAFIHMYCSQFQVQFSIHRCDTTRQPVVQGGSLRRFQPPAAPRCAVRIQEYA